MLKARSGKQFEIPREGPHAAVLAAVQDCGMMRGFEGNLVHKVRFIWILDQLDAKDGNPLILFSFFNFTLGERSNLRRAITIVTGVDPDYELDLHTLIGAQATVVVAHYDSYGHTKARPRKVDGIKPATLGENVPIPHGWKPPEVKHYVAPVDDEEDEGRPLFEPPDHGEAGEATMQAVSEIKPEISDEDIPF